MLTINSTQAICTSLPLPHEGMLSGYEELTAFVFGAQVCSALTWFHWLRCFIFLPREISLLTFYRLLPYACILRTLDHYWIVRLSLNWLVEAINTSDLITPLFI